MESFIPDPLFNLITVSNLDGRQIGELKPEFYDKVTFHYFSYAAPFVFLFCWVQKNIRTTL